MTTNPSLSRYQLEVKKAEIADLPRHLLFFNLKPEYSVDIVTGDKAKPSTIGNKCIIVRTFERKKLKG